MTTTTRAPDRRRPLSLALTLAAVMLAGCGVGTSGTFLGPGGQSTAPTGAAGTGVAPIVEPPAIASISPASGPLAGGTVLTIRGSLLSDVDEVDIGRAPASGLSVDPAGAKLTCVAPAGDQAGAVDVTVHSASRGDAIASAAYAYNPLPVITHVSPSSGSLAGGTPVTITGKHFGGRVIVFVGASQATSVVVASGNVSLTCITPAGLASGPANVVVQSSSSGEVEAPGAFIYNPGPTIASLSPADGPLAGGTTLTILGANFGGTVAVTVGGAVATLLSVSADGTTVQCTTPSSATAGARDVVVTASANGVATAAGGFTYDPLPTITGVTPASGPEAGGTSAMIAGTSFAGAVGVTFGGRAATGVAVDASQTHVTCNVPAGAAPGAVAVVVTSSARGQANLSNAYTYLSPPQVQTVTPASGPLAGLTPLTISGSGFGGIVAVAIGSRAATSVAASTDGRTLTCVTPPGAAPVAADLSVTSTTNGSVVSIGAYTYNPTVVIGAVAPSSGPLGGGTPLLITGSGFLPTVSVTIGTLAATSVSVTASGTQINCVTPRGAQPGPANLAVTSAPGGAPSSASSPSFAYNPLPSVARVTPTSGPLAGGTTLVVDGSAFLGVVKVLVGGQSATSVTTVGGTSRILCLTPGSSSTGAKDVEVDASLAGTAILHSGFTYNPRPTIAGVLPTQGPRAGGTTLGISGTGFVGVTRVTVGGSAASSVAVASPTLLTAVSPASTTTGPVDVVVTSSAGGTAVATGAFVYRTVSFASHQDFPAVPQPIAIALGDINGDGKPDLVVSSATRGQVGFLLGQGPVGPGLVGFAAAQTIGSPAIPLRLALGDLNGDGRLDLAVSTAAASEAFLGNNANFTGSTTISFGAPLTAPAPGPTDSVVLADLNNDGVLDAVIACGSAHTVSLALNVTAPGAAVPALGPRLDLPVAGTPVGLAVGDLNGDGKPDLAVTLVDASAVEVFLNQTPIGATRPAFGPGLTLATGASPQVVSIADINGDHLPDLIVANSAGATISIFPNITAPGATTPAFAPRVDLPCVAGPIALTVADVSGDARPDIVAAGRDAGGVCVLVNVSTPGSLVPAFLPFVSFPTGAGASGVVVGDFNFDGLPDIATPDMDANAVSVLLGTTDLGTANATATFGGRADFSVGGQARGIAVGDLNGDGKPDVVTADTGANRISICLGQTSPGASQASFAIHADMAVGLNPVAVAIGDLNGDGRPDLVAADNSGAAVSILYNTAPVGAVAPSFTLDQEVPVATGPNNVALADINGDGKPDVVTANGAGNVSVLLNRTVAGATVPSFVAHAEFTTVANAVALAVGDLNGDGRPDIVAGSSGTGSLSVLLNRTAPGAVAASFSAHADFTVAAAVSSVALADFNGDGKPDIAAATSGGSVTVLVNQTSAGSLVPAFGQRLDITVGGQLSAIAAFDVNGDGLPDVVVLNHSATENNVAVLINTTVPSTGILSFGAPITFTAVNPASGLAVTDLDGNFRPDLLIAADTSTAFSALLNLTRP